MKSSIPFFLQSFPLFHWCLHVALLCLFRRSTTWKICHLFASHITFLAFLSNKEQPNDNHWFGFYFCIWNSIKTTLCDGEANKLGNTCNRRIKKYSCARLPLSSSTVHEPFLFHEHEQSQSWSRFPHPPPHQQLVQKPSQQHRTIAWKSNKAQDESYLWFTQYQISHPIPKAHILLEQSPRPTPLPILGINFQHILLPSRRGTHSIRDQPPPPPCASLFSQEALFDFYCFSCTYIVRAEPIYAIGRYKTVGSRRTDRPHSLTPISL